MASPTTTTSSHSQSTLSAAVSGISIGRSGPISASRELREQGGVLGERAAHLQDVRPVVQPDADILPGCGMTMFRGRPAQPRGPRSTRPARSASPHGQQGQPTSAAPSIRTPVLPSTVRRGAVRGANGGQSHRAASSICDPVEMQPLDDRGVGEPEQIEGLVARAVRSQRPGDPGRHDEQVALGQLVGLPTEGDGAGALRRPARPRSRAPGGSGAGTPPRSRWNRPGWREDVPAGGRVAWRIAAWPGATVAGDPRLQGELIARAGSVCPPVGTERGAHHVADQDGGRRPGWHQSRF